MKKICLLLMTVLCSLGVSAATTYATYYKVSGGLYEGMAADCKVGRNIVVPFGGTLTFTTFDGADGTWMYNTTSKGTGPSTTMSGLKMATNYYPITLSGYTNAQYDYVYGNGSSRIQSAPADPLMLSMCSSYCQSSEGGYAVDCKTAATWSTSDTYGTNIKYGTKITHKTYGAVQAYEMVVDNPDVMYMDYAVLGIFGYPKTSATTIANMIPEGKSVTLELYPATLTLTDGVYSYTKTSSTPIVTSTATASNFTADGSNSYRGALKFAFSEPISISGDYVARLTWDDGCDFGLLTDAYNRQNYTTFYCFDGKTTTLWTGGGNNASISYHAMFPALCKADNTETVRFSIKAEQSKDLTINTNLAPEDVTVTNTASEWLNYELTAVEGGLKLTLTTTSAASVSRKGVVTLTARGKTISYDVRQDVVKLVVTDAKWSTYISAVGFTPEVEGLAIKTVTFDGDKLEYTDVTKITQFEPVVLYSEKPYSKPYSFSTNVYSFVFEDSYTLGPLVGVLVDTDVTPASTDSYNYYFLQNLNGVVAWYLGEENVTYTVTANHCYLKIEKSAGAPVRAFYFDTPTGIDALTTQLATGKNVRTNLAGQVVNDSYKGIVIENGKKFIKK